MRSVINYDVEFFESRNNITLYFIGIGITYDNPNPFVIENQVSASQIDVTAENKLRIRKIFPPYFQ
ncbi:hypothetical protein ASD12_01050 [Mesorhizobium sp. Root102]|nr:hypothetical protein ASD12_01050 [Mesorhizobium sp. Root102]